MTRSRSRPTPIFPLASISKTVAATAIMRLVEQGKIDLSAPVQKYLPDFRVQDDAVSREVTIWHLLTHTPGWEGQLSAEDRGVHTLAGFLDALKPTAATGAAGHGLELQQCRASR